MSGTKINEPVLQESQQVAFLSNEIAELKQLMHKVLTAQTETNLKIGLMSLQSQHSEEKLKRLFALSDEHADNIKLQDKTLSIHAFIWKLIGSGAIASFGVLSWGYATLQGMTDTQNSNKNRLNIIEYQLNNKDFRESYQRQQTTGQK